MSKSAEETPTSKMARLIVNEIRLGFDCYREALTAVTGRLLDEAENERRERVADIKALRHDIAALRQMIEYRGPLQ
jgi:hypothetical protein